MLSLKVGKNEKTPIIPLETGTFVRQTFSLPS